MEKIHSQPLSLDPFTFAGTDISYPDGQVNRSEPGASVMAGGFLPQISGAPGQPLPAQHLNYLFHKAFDRINALAAEVTRLSEALADAEARNEVINV